VRCKQKAEVQPEKRSGEDPPGDWALLCERRYRLPERALDGFQPAGRLFNPYGTAGPAAASG